jgi:hypothetical protein
MPPTLRSQNLYAASLPSCVITYAAAAALAVSSAAAQHRYATNVAVMKQEKIVHVLCAALV